MHEQYCRRGSYTVLCLQHFSSLLPLLFKAPMHGFQKQVLKAVACAVCGMRASMPVCYFGHNFLAAHCRHAVPEHITSPQLTRQRTIFTAVGLGYWLCTLHRIVLDAVFPCSSARDPRHAHPARSSPSDPTGGWWLGYQYQLAFHAKAIPPRSSKYISDEDLVQ